MHNLWHLARFVIRQIEMLFICGTCAPAQPEADDDKCENVDDVHGLSPGVALTVWQAPLPLSPLSQSALSADLFLAVFLFVIRFLRVYKLNASSCAASALLATSWFAPAPLLLSAPSTPLLSLAHSIWLVAICLANCANCSRRDNLIKHISLPPPAPCLASVFCIVLGQNRFNRLPVLPITHTTAFTDCAWLHVCVCDRRLHSSQTSDSRQRRVKQRAKRRSECRREGKRGCLGPNQTDGLTVN